MKVFTYLRVSTENQTVDPQRLELLSYCQRQGWQISAEFVDVISGAKASRVGLDAMIERCASGEAEAVVVVKLDRLGRSILNVVSLVQQLAKMGVAVICSSQGIDTRKSSPCGTMIIGVMAAFAQFEKEIISDRTKAGLRNARAKGKVLGRASTKLASKELIPDIISRWLAADKPGGFRGLATLLGGCSPTTARRLASALTAPLAGGSVEV